MSNMIMQRSATSKLRLVTKVLQPKIHITPSNPAPCQVFLNHRGIDTKRTIVGLLYQHLSSHGLNPFLDIKSMRPGDKLLDKIDEAIKLSRVGVAVFSPRYCESYYCLHELALMMEFNKKMVPIFVDVKPSELKIKDDGSFSIEELKQFRWAIDEAKSTVGISFDTSVGDWSKFITSATGVIKQSLLEAQENQ